MLITDAAMKVEDGVVIEIETVKIVQNGDKLGVKCEEELYFEVIEVNVSDHNLLVKAKEVGFWNSKFDLRNLIGLNVHFVNTKEQVKQMYQMYQMRQQMSQELSSY